MSSPVDHFNLIKSTKLIFHIYDSLMYNDVLFLQLLFRNPPKGYKKLKCFWPHKFDWPPFPASTSQNEWCRWVVNKESNVI